MIGSNFIFDGVDIPYSTADGIAEGWYADVDWTDVRVRNSILPRQDFHGSISFPTFAEGRLINVKGEIFNTQKVNRGTIRNVVKNLFQIVDFPSSDNEIKELHFTDDDGTDWFIRCKVYTMPDFTHSRAYPIINFSVQLYAEDPLIRSKNKKTGNGIYGLYGGVTLPTTLPIPLLTSLNSFIIANAGNFASYVKATVKAVTDNILNPKVWNLTTGTYYKLNKDLLVGEELVIDTETTSVKIDGDNAESFRADGSTFLFAVSGDNNFLLTGDNFEFSDQSKATLDIEFYDVNL